MPACSSLKECCRRFWRREIDPALRHHGLVIFLASLVFAAGHLLALVTRREMAVYSSVDFIEKYVLFAGTWVLAATILYKFAHIAFVARSHHPLGEFLQWLRRDIFSVRRVVNGVFGIIAFFLLMSGFTLAKNAIPGFGGFRWDEQLAVVGRMINFGHRGYELLQPFVGRPEVTQLLDRVYLLWFPVMFSSFFVASFGYERSLHRHRFILSVIMAWSVGGIVLATVYASAGPVYFDKVTGLVSPYAPLFHYLAQVDANGGVDALGVRDELWRAFTSRPSVSFISSFPSMHVTMATLIALACYSLGYVARISSAIFAVMIFLGSIHLGWHYTIDSYAGILLAMSAWAFSAPLSRWYFARLEASAQVDPQSIVIQAA